MSSRNQPASGRTLRAMHRQCLNRLDSIPIPTPFDLEVFCDALSLRRRRPIVLHAMASTPYACGMWIATDRADHVFHEEATSLVHQEHIVLHELSHMVCDHDSGRLHGRWAVELLPDLDPETVCRVLRRYDYSLEQEREAEVLATLIADRAPRPGRLHEGPRELVAVRARLRTALVEGE